MDFRSRNQLNSLEAVLENYFKEPDLLDFLVFFLEGPGRECEAMLWLSDIKLLTLSPLVILPVPDMWLMILSVSS